MCAQSVRGFPDALQLAYYRIRAAIEAERMREVGARMVAAIRERELQRAARAALSP